MIFKIISPRQKYEKLPGDKELNGGDNKISEGIHI